MSSPNTPCEHLTDEQQTLLFDVRTKEALIAVNLNKKRITIAQNADINYLKANYPDYTLVIRKMKKVTCPQCNGDGYDFQPIYRILSKEETDSDGI